MIEVQLTLPEIQVFMQRSKTSEQSTGHIPQCPDFDSGAEKFSRELLDKQKKLSLGSWHFSNSSM